MKESKLCDGRVGVHCPEHPFANNRGYVLRYRYIMEQHLGRMLDSTECIHHVDGDKTNDDISNLVLISRSAHSLEHIADTACKRKHDWDRIRELYMSGLGCRRIATIIGSTKHGVQYAVNTMGIRR